MRYFKSSLQIVDEYKLQHEINGFFGRCLWAYKPEDKDFIVECWDSAEGGWIIFQIFKSAVGLVVYRPKKVYECKDILPIAW